MLFKRESSTPKDDIISTALADERQRGDDAVEDYPITVLPEMPKAKKTEGRASACWR
jgi:hypothetical protein